ncbi:unnamed protein product, partial [Amoebophrya sp. A120]|eukprot:GSA120T00014677001.1
MDADQARARAEAGQQQEQGGGGGGVLSGLTGMASRAASSITGGGRSTTTAGNTGPTNAAPNQMNNAMTMMGKMNAKSQRIAEARTKLFKKDLLEKIIPEAIEQTMRDRVETALNRFTAQFVTLHTRHENDELRTKICERVFPHPDLIRNDPNAQDRQNEDEWFRMKFLAADVLVKRNDRSLRKLASGEQRHPVLMERKRIIDFVEYLDGARKGPSADDWTNFKAMLHTPAVVVLEQLTTADEFIARDAHPKFLAHLITKLITYADENSDPMALDKKEQRKIE